MQLYSSDSVKKIKNTNVNSLSKIAFGSKTVYIPAGNVRNIVLDQTGSPARTQLLEATCSWKALSVPNVFIDT